MQTIQQRRFSLGRIFGGPVILPRRNRVPSRRSSANMLLMEDLESRVLLAGTPTQLIFLTQPSQTAVGSSIFPPVQVEIADAAGLQTADTSRVVLSILVGPTGATINNGSAVSATAVAGIASFDNLIFNATGNYTLVATDGALHNRTASTFTVTVPAAQVNFLQSLTTVTAGQLFSTAVEIDDAGGLHHPVTTDHSTVTLTIASGPDGATIVGTATATPVNGVVTFTGISLPKAGTYKLSVQDGTLAGGTSNTFTVNVGVAAGLAFVGQPGSTPVDGTIAPVAVGVVDAFGNVVTTNASTVTLAMLSGVPGLSPVLGTTSMTAVNGVATFSDLSVGAAGAYVLQATDGAFTGNSSSFNITGVADHVAFLVQPSQVTVDQPITPGVQVAVMDALDHVIVSDTSSVTISTSVGPGALSGTTTVAAVNGVATFTDLSLDQGAANYGFTAIDGTLTSADSNSFLVNGLPSQLEFTQQPVGSPFGAPLETAVQVTIEDSSGNPVLDATSDVTITLAGTGSLTGTLTVTAVGGVATFNDLVISALGDYQFDATDGVLTGATSSTFTMLPGATSVTFVTGPSKVAQGSAMGSVVVDVLDSNSAPMLTNTSPVTIVLLNGPVGGSMNGTTTVTAIAGQATFNDLSFTKPGTYTILATDGNLVTETSVDFVVTAPAAKLLFVNQPIVTSMAGTILPAFSVRVTDAKANTITSDGSAVTLSIIGPAGSTIGGTTTVSAINGIATFNDIMLTIAGKYNFTVSDGLLTGATSSAMSITPLLTAIPDPNSTQSNLLINPVIGVSSNAASALVGKNLQFTTTSSSISQSFQVTQQDRYGNIITTLNNGTASVHILSGPQLQLVGTVTAKFVKGVASFKNIVINTAGDYVLRVESFSSIPDVVPYNVTGTQNITTTVTPVTNSMRAPTHAANYAFGAPITLSANVGSVVASSGIKYLNGTASETARLVNIAGATLETGTVNATGAVNFNFNDLVPGNYDVFVIYDGDANHTGARTPLFHFAVGPTITTLTASPLTLNSGATLTLTATVKSVLSGQLLTSGNVQFFEDSNLTPIGTVAISGNAGHPAVFAFVPTAGAHTYKAVFVANSSLGSSTSTLKLVTVS